MHKKTYIGNKYIQYMKSLSFTKTMLLLKQNNLLLSGRLQTSSVIIQ